MRSWIATLRSRGLLAQVSLLGLAVLVVYAVVAPVAVAASGWEGLAASATAALLCLLGAVAALIASRAFALRGRMLESMLVGALRMGTPLGFGLALQLSIRPLADAYLLVYLLVYSPVTLFVETFLSLPGAGSRGVGNGRSSAVAS